MTELGQDAWDALPGEDILLNGTDSSNLHKILCEGLNLDIALNGKLGSGNYFAQSAATIDQYATEDTRY
jgi:hypothetical protein